MTLSHTHAHACPSSCSAAAASSSSSSWIVHTLGEWGTGVSRRNQKEGAFPWSYVQPFQQQASVGHKFEPINVTVPTVDWHTHAFIWGAGIAGEAVHCTGTSIMPWHMRPFVVAPRSSPPMSLLLFLHLLTPLHPPAVCGFTCHKRSKFFVENNSASECIPTRNIVRPSTRPVEEWTPEDVHLFMVAVSLVIAGWLIVCLGCVLCCGFTAPFPRSSQLTPNRFLPFCRACWLLSAVLLLHMGFCARSFRGARRTCLTMHCCFCKRV